MKRNIHKNLLGMLKSKGILAISGGLLLVSCGAQMGGYSETDGVYYDPNKDTLPEGVIINERGNRVGDDYNYYQDDTNVVQNAEMNSREGRYEDWNNYNWNSTATDSDWGNFAGSQTNYYDSSWGSPWGMYGGYSPWGWGGGWGLGLSWAGAAPGVGAAAGTWVGDIHLIGAAITHTGAAFTVMDIHTAAGVTAADTGVATTTLSTEEVHPAEEDLIHTTEALPTNTG